MSKQQLSWGKQKHVLSDSVGYLEDLFWQKSISKATQAIQGLDYRCENTTVIELIQNGKRCISLLKTPGITGKRHKTLMWQDFCIQVKPQNTMPTGITSI